MVYRTPYPWHIKPYPWYIESFLMVLWTPSFDKNEGVQFIMMGFKIPWQKFDPGVKIPYDILNPGWIFQGFKIPYDTDIRILDNNKILPTFSLTRYHTTGIFLPIHIGAVLVFSCMVVTCRRTSSKCTITKFASSILDIYIVLSMFMLSFIFVIVCGLLCGF